MELMEHYQPAVPSYFGGSLLKVRAVITAGVKSQEFRKMLESNTRQAITSAGVDMSRAGIPCGGRHRVRVNKLVAEQGIRRVCC